MLTESQKQQWRENRHLSTGQVVGQLPDDAKPYASIVGSWVWLDFPQYPGRVVLDGIKSLGFKWSKKRRAWQHPCGDFRTFNPHGDPRLKYGQIPISAMDDEKRAVA